MFIEKQIKNSCKKSIGEYGERIAYQYLKRNKYRILKKNYREKFDEIDIIAKSRIECLIFFEVKTINYPEDKLINMLSPEDNFTISKFRKIKRLCEMFVAKHKKIINWKVGWRIDLITIEIYETKNKILIKHYKNVYK